MTTDEIVRNLLTKTYSTDDEFDDAEHVPVEEPYRHNACRKCTTGTYYTTGRYDIESGIEWDYEHVCDTCGHTIWKIV